MAENTTNPTLIRVAADGYLAAYLRYAIKLTNEDKLNSFSVTGSGAAIESAIRVGELLRRVYPTAHRIVSIGLRDFTREGSRDRSVPFVEVNFSLKDDLDKSAPGYQGPLGGQGENVEALIESLKNVRGRRPRPRDDAAPAPAHGDARGPRLPRESRAPRPPRAAPVVDA